MSKFKCENLKWSIRDQRNVDIASMLILVSGLSNSAICNNVLTLTVFNRNDFKIPSDIAVISYLKKISQDLDFPWILSSLRLRVNSGPNLAPGARTADDFCQDQIRTPFLQMRNWPT